MGGPGSGGNNKTAPELIERMNYLRHVRGWKGIEIAREVGVCPDTVWRLTRRPQGVG